MEEKKISMKFTFFSGGTGAQNVDEEVLSILLKEAVLVNVVTEVVGVTTSFFSSFSKNVMRSSRFTMVTVVNPSLILR